MGEGRITITGERNVPDPDESEYVSELERVTVTLPGEDGAAQYRCRNCSDELAEYPEGFRHESTGTLACFEVGDDTEDAETAEPERIPLSWANSASIIMDDEHDELAVSISVGDPRGGFFFSIRRVAELFDGDGTLANPELAGKLIMHLPHPGEGLPHVETSELHPGTLLIGGAA